MRYFLSRAALLLSALLLTGVVQAQCPAQHSLLGFAVESNASAPKLTKGTESGHAYFCESLPPTVSAGEEKEAKITGDPGDIFDFSAPYTLSDSDNSTQFSFTILMTNSTCWLNVKNGPDVLSFPTAEWNYTVTLTKQRIHDDVHIDCKITVTSAPYEEPTEPDEPTCPPDCGDDEDPEVPVTQATITINNQTQ